VRNKFSALLAMLAIAVLLTSTGGVFARGFPPPGAPPVVRTTRTDEDVGRAVLKALLAVALHDASKPDPRDTFGDSLARAVARAGRDAAIDSALQDLFPTARPAERAAVRNLTVLSLDGRLPRDRDSVLAEVRRNNPDMADAVQAAEFLIRFSQAAERRR